MLDLAIVNGFVVTPHAEDFCDIGIVGEKIVAIAAPGSLAATAGRVLDATAKIVVPGGIDPHIHSKWPIPSADGSIGAFTADAEQVSRAALHGGTTTLIDFAVWEPGSTLAQSVERRSGDFRGSYCDYAYHL